MVAGSDYSTPIRVGNRVVGEVVKRDFVKHVRASKHMLKTPPGWAADAQSLDTARTLGADRVVIVDVESGSVYSSSVDQIVRKGFVLNRGHGTQVCLPLSHWCVQRPGEAQQLSFAFGETR